MTTDAHSAANNGRGRHGRQDWAQFWTRDWLEVDWLYEDVLARGRGHAIWAKHGQQKSLFMLWVATELTRAGHVVVYLDWEMSESDLFERLSDMGFGPHSDLKRLVYINHVELPPLDTPDGGSELGIWLDEIAEEFLGRHLAVVIDTIGRAVSGEENSNDTVQAFYRYAGQELRMRGVTWVRLDHAGHEGEHARGASAKGDDVDIVWHLQSADDGLTLKVNKRRMSWVPEHVVFRRVDDGTLRYEPTKSLWPDGTKELARILDTLGVPITATTRTVQQRLRDSGDGRRREVVVAAQKYRRWLQEQGVEPPDLRPGTTPEPLLSAGSGNHAGTTDRKPDKQGQEPPPEPPGTTPGGTPGTTGGVSIGTPPGPEPVIDDLELAHYEGLVGGAG